MRLAGRVALVAGAARGAGLATAERLAAEGARLVLADSGTGRDGYGSDPRLARDLAKRLNGLAHVDSLASPGSAKAAVALAERLGGLDLLVCALSIRRDAPLPRAAPGDVEAVLRNNLLAPIYLLRAAAAVFRPGGRAVLLVDAAGCGQAAFAAAAAGLIGLAEAATADLAPREVTVAALATSGATPAEVARAVLALADGPAVAGLTSVPEILNVASQEDTP
jgi:3-oxoacyl-[acyl-carrier protein] reductase